MKHEPSPFPETPSSPPLMAWNVYNASHVLVATYSQEAAAASHVACWPALYYALEPRVPVAPVFGLSLPS